MEKYTEQNHTEEKIPDTNIEIEPDFVDFIPQEFYNDPFGYFEREGKNIKTGEIKFDESGKIHEDPSAVKDFPIWKNSNGIEMLTVARKINVSKGVVGESGDPFYEYKILKQLSQMGLRVARPVAKIEQNGIHIIVMERIPGIRWSERDTLNLKKNGYSDDDITDLINQAEYKMNDLKIQFDNLGIVRGWKLKDMVFQIDVANKKIVNVIPTDWERTKIIK